MDIVGHRGASHDAPENTLASVKLAWRRNADAVEIDVYLSRDGRIVVIHDETTKRTAGRDRKVVEQTAEDLKKLDAGRWKGKRWAGEHIPLLSEVLPTIPAGKTLYIEVKCGKEIVPELKRVLKAAGRKPHETAVIGFSYPAMQAVRRALPELNVYWIVGLKRDKKTGRWGPPLGEIIRKTRAAKFAGVHLGNAPVIDGEYVSRIRQSGLKVFVWTVDSLKDARRLKRAGVDGITTNRPGWLKERLDPR